VNATDGETLVWLRNEFSGFPSRPRLLVQLSSSDHAGYRYVQALCLAEDFCREYLWETASLNVPERLFDRLAALSQLQYLELYMIPVAEIGAERLSRLSGLQYIGMPEDTDDSHLALLKGQKGLKSLNLCSTRITGRGLVALSHLPQLRTLDLRRTKLTCDSLSVLTACAALETLFLSETDVNDQAVRALVELPRLKTVALHNTRITDASVECLLELPRLEHVSLYGTLVSEQGWKLLSERRPNVRIVQEPPRTVEEFVAERRLALARLGDRFMQGIAAYRSGRAGDYVDCLTWYLVLSSEDPNGSGRPDSVVSARIEAARAELSADLIAEAERRASVYLLLKQYTDVEIGRPVGEPLFQYGFSWLD